MRKRRALGIVVIAATVAGTIVASPSGTAPPPASVEGAGWVVFSDFPGPGQTTEEQLIVSAHIGPDGEARGTMLQHSEFGDVRAEVTCLIQVDDNTAYVGGRITRGFEYLGLKVSHVALGIDDNGQGKDPPDLVASAIFVDRPRPPDFDPCTVLRPFPPVFVVARGNYVVGNGPRTAPRVFE
jgi:hypothetical protein